MEFGDRIKMLRKEKKLTQEELADASGVAVSSIINYENKRRKNPPFEQLQKLATALDVDILYLTRGPETVQVADDLLDKFNRGKDSHYDDKLLGHFHKLNDGGKIVAIERVEELTGHPRYQKKED